jgi:hypothetical protein
MRALLGVCLLLVAPALICARSSPQQPPESSANNSDVATELKALREALLQTRQQVASQQREIEALKEQSKAGQVASVGNEQPPGMIEAATRTASPFSPERAASFLGLNAGNQPVDQQEENQKESPLSFKVGTAVFTPGGFVDFENIFRTTNTQSNLATSFASIPFSNTAQGHLTELRTTAQFSRFDLKVTDKFGANDVTAYCEADFSGNDAANVYQSVNGHTLRVRLCFADLKRGNWEVLGGQTWSWLTPNRSGVGPMPSELAITYNEDQNTGIGLPYTRAAEFRVAYHVNDHWAMGVGIEDANQFIGGFVALPSAFSATLSPQFDNGSQIGTPNLFPDIIPKITYDTNLANRHFHLEAVGLVTAARFTFQPTAGAPFSPRSTVGGGGSLAGNFQLTHSLVFLANAFWSDGGAHYLVATGPQVVVRPDAAGTDLTPSMVHAGAGSVGLEWNATRRTILAAYYGMDYFGRNFFPDTTNTAHPDTIIGYGGPGSPNTNNRTIQQPTIDWLQTFWQNPKYGSLLFYSQTSYLTRAPWSIAPGAPKNAHLVMVYAGVRYVLPTASGTLQQVLNPY